MTTRGEILQHAKLAFDAYYQQASTDPGDGSNPASKRREALWAEFQRWLSKLAELEGS